MDEVRARLLFEAGLYSIIYSSCSDNRHKYVRSFPKVIQDATMMKEGGIM